MSSLPSDVSSSRDATKTTFTLQADTTCNHGNTTVVGAVLLKFAHPVVEEDFLRFKLLRGRHVHLLLVFAAFAAWGASRIWIAPNGLVIAVHSVQTTFAAVASAVYVASVVIPGRSADLTQTDSATLAARAEAVSFLFGIVSAFVEAGFIPYEAVASCTHEGGDEWCHYYSISVPIGLMPLITLWIRPRVKKSVVSCLAAAIGFLGGCVPVDAYSPVDYAAAVLLLLTAFVVVTIQAVAAERRERQHFVDHVRLTRAEEKLAAMMAHTKDILRSAMPPELLNDDMTLAATTHRSDCATVGMSDIYDFAQWSCGLLVEDVVLNLHMLLTMCDVGADEHGVVRAMTYGDCYVVCSGLIEPGGNHTQAVLQFEQWLVGAATAAWQAFAWPLSIRASVCTGPLFGQVAGEVSLRYVVSGEALDVARDAVAEAGANDVVLCDDVVSLSARGARYAPLVVAPASLATSMVPLDVSHHAADNIDAVEAWSPDTDRSVVPEFSAVWLTFRSVADRDGFALFIAETDADVGRFIAVTPPCVFGAFLLVMLLEFLARDERRHHDDGLLPMAGLAAATVIGSLVLAVRLAAVPVPVAVLYVATAVSLSIGMVSLIFTGCIFSTAHWYVSLLLCLPSLFQRLPWLAQTALQFATVIVPIVVWITQYYRYATNSVAVFCFIMFSFIAARYSHSRAACRQYVAAACAAVATHAAASKATHQKRLLLGLLPPHVVRHAQVDSVSSAAATAALTAPSYRENWDGLSALQLSVHTWRTEAGRPAMADVWRCVTAVLDDESRLLEMAQATGDTFLVAGPFVRRGAASQKERDQRRQRAARGALALARELSEALRDVCCFTAVLTAGSACGALLGASLLSFRLFGPIVRESNALLAAAPQTTMQSVAFASAGFRQQHRNFAAPSNAAAADAAMSAAMLMSQEAHGDIGIGTAPSSSGLALSGSTPVDADAFLPGARWRVRGVGVAVVHQITLAGSE
jgi:hypothetical protein